MSNAPRAPDVFLKCQKCIFSTQSVVEFQSHPHVFKCGHCGFFTSDGDVFIKHLEKGHEEAFATQFNQQHPGQGNNEKSQIRPNLYPEKGSAQKNGYANLDKSKHNTANGNILQGRSSRENTANKNSNGTSTNLSTITIMPLQQVTRSRHILPKPAQKKTTNTIDVPKSDSNNNVNKIQTDQQDKTDDGFSCCKCNYSTKTREAYLTHSHTLRCTMCLYATTNEGTFQQHWKQQHGSAKIPIELKEVLTAKDESNNVHKCTECKFSTVWKKDLDQHFAQNHSFKCDKCNYKAKAKWLLNSHIMRSHTTEKNKSKKRKSTENTSVASAGKKSKHSCHYCNESFDTVGQVTKHTYMTHREKLPFKCNDCAYAVDDQYCLQIHIQVEHPSSQTADVHNTSNSSGEYVCTLCDLRFKSKEYANHHKSQKHQYKCTVCNLQFMRYNQLYTHREAAHFKNNATASPASSSPSSVV